MITTISPATGKPLATYPLMDANEALGIAKAVHEQHQRWKQTSFEERKKRFLALAAVLEKNKVAYATMMAKEMGKVLKEGIAEVEKCAWLAKVLVEKGEQWLAEESVDAGGLEHKIVYEPLGTIYLIMPWNFPFWQPLKVGLP
ncbi:MAG: aldehyde dehydrogenase family protein, partial [Candidatus Woesearchaeota archaeon]